MSIQSKPENYLAEALRFNSALVQMSESELTQLLNSVAALQEDFQLIPLRNGQSVQVVAAAQSFLKIWNDELDRILAHKQVKDIYNQLPDWDHEGGGV